MTLHDADVVLPSRRRWLRGGRLAVRPPAALEEADFVERCVRCDACSDACVTGVLRRGDGGYPELRFDDAECTFCGDCERACTHGALDARRARTWPWRARIDAAACLASGGVVCRSCADACPLEALSFARSLRTTMPALDPQRCNGCGACAAACPAQAAAIVATELPA